MIKRIAFLSLICLSFFALVNAQTTRPTSFTGKPQYQLEINRAGVFLGNINIELFPTIAPKHVRNFDSLVSAKAFDSTAFHRVIPGFMIQGGDPNSINGPRSTWGYGDPSQLTVPAEFSAAPHLRGTLAAARDADTNSATSQFYICVAPASWLNGQYTVYGRTTSGMNIVDTIVSAPRDANDNPYQKFDMFITYTGENTSVPAAPVITSPADNSQNIPMNQLLKWNAVTDAVVYQLEISTDSTFSTFFFNNDVAGPTYTISNLVGSTKYFWRVKTNNGGAFSTYSNTWSFTTSTGAANLLYPGNTSTQIPVNPVFSWDAVAGATSYRLQVSKTSTFSAANMVFDQPGLTSTSQQVTGLNPSTTYYWRVRSANGSVEGFYSAKWSFTTGITTSINSLHAVENRLEQNSPNPGYEKTAIKYSIANQERVTIKLYDLIGREVSTLVNEEKAKGEHALNIDLSKYQSGIYFYKIQAGKFTETKKLVIRK